MKALVRPLLSCAVLLAAFSASQARADFVTYGTPSPAYTGSTILLTSPASDFTNITSLTGPFMTVTFSDPVNVRTVPSGGWATWSSPPWSETSTPQVYTPGQSSLTLTLSNPTTTFGFELEPNPFALHSYGVNFYQGLTLVGTINNIVDGSAGARLFGATTSTNWFNRVTISGSADFAIGRIRYTPNPEPGTLALAGAGIAMAIRRFRRRK